MSPASKPSFSEFIFWRFRCVRVTQNEGNKMVRGSWKRAGSFSIGSYPKFLVPEFMITDFVFPCIHFQSTSCLSAPVLSSDLSQKIEELGHEKRKNFRLKLWVSSCNLCQDHEFQCQASQDHFSFDYMRGLEHFFSFSPFLQLIVRTLRPQARETCYIVRH